MTYLHTPSFTGSHLIAFSQPDMEGFLQISFILLNCVLEALKDFLKGRLRQLDWEIRLPTEAEFTRDIQAYLISSLNHGISDLALGRALWWEGL